MPKGARVVRDYLVDIDLLYDLRLTLMDRLSPMVALSSLHADNYTTRVSDLELAKELGIKKQEWLGRYEGEFMSLLKQSSPTYFRNNLVPITNEYLDDTAPGSNVIKNLTINIPYGHLFTDEEHDRMLQLLDTLYGDYFDSIRIISKEYSKINYTEFVQRYTDYFCYRYDLFIKAYHDVEPEKYKPSFRLWTPSLIWGQEEDLDQTTLPDVKKLMELHPVFSMVQFVYMPAFEIHWLDPREILDQRISYIGQKNKS